MTSLIDLYIRRFKEVHYKTPWYGKGIKASFQDYVPNILKDNSLHAKSIQDLGGHIEQWRQFALAKLRGDVSFDIELNTAHDWPDTSDMNWEEMMKQLDKSLDELCTCLKEHDDSLFARQVPGKSYNFRFLLDGVIYHDIYHLGQMNMIYSILNRKEEKP